MFYDVTIIYAQVCNLIIFFAKWYVLGWEVNNNIQEESFSIISGINGKDL